MSILEYNKSACVSHCNHTDNVCLAVRVIFNTTHQDAVEYIEAVSAEMRMPRVGESSTVDHLENHHASLFIVVQWMMLDIGVDVVHREQDRLRCVGIDNGEVDGLSGRHLVVSGIALALIVYIEDCSRPNIAYLCVLTSYRPR